MATVTSPQIYPPEQQVCLEKFGAHFAVSGVCANMPDSELENLLDEHYYRDGWIRQDPDKYHFRVSQGACPCCGQYECEEE